MFLAVGEPLAEPMSPEDRAGQSVSAQHREVLGPHEFQGLQTQDDRLTRQFLRRQRREIPRAKTLLDAPLQFRRSRSLGQRHTRHRSNAHAHAHGSLHEFPTIHGSRVHA